VGWATTRCGGESRKVSAVAVPVAVAIPPIVAIAVIVTAVAALTLLPEFVTLVLRLATVIAVTIDFAFESLFGPVNAPIAIVVTVARLSRR
jgi:hypothetical protein